MTVREALDVYFKTSGFDESTYTDTWVKLPVLGRSVYLPNIKARRVAVPLHDIDHVLTGYPTDWRGEFQISAYEIGTGCGRYWAGWMINSQAILMGGVVAPSQSVNAFARGRRSKGVYSLRSRDEVLHEDVGSLRARLTSEPVAAGFSDAVLFYAWFLLSVAAHVLPFAIVLFAFSRIAR